MAGDLQQTRYDQVVRRVGGIIGPGAKVSEALAELFPVIDLENLPGELLLLGGTRLGFGGGQIGALAGESPRAQLFNPVGSGQLVTITRVIASFAAIGVTRWGLRNLAIETDVGSQLARDTRVTGGANTVADVRQGTDVALANATGQTRLLGNTPLTLDDPDGVAVLSPGNGFEIGTSTVNTAMNYCFYWRERLALASELSLNP